MKIEYIDRKNGFAKFWVETLDDLWHVENLVEKGDLLYASVFRRIKNEKDPEKKSERKPVKITLEAESAKFDRYADRLRVSGVIKEGFPEKFVSIGAHQTIDIETGSKIKMWKPKWKKYHISRLKEAEIAVKRPKMIIVSMDESESEAAVIKEYGLEFLGRIESKIPGKRMVVKKDTSKKEFFEEIEQQLSGVPVDAIILSGPGFTKTNFKTFLAEKKSPLLEKTTVKNTGQSGKTGVFEIIKSGGVTQGLEEARVIKETKMLEEILKEIAVGGKATYGLAQAEKAASVGAVETLAINDSLLREKRNQCEKIFTDTESSNGKVMIFNSENESGKILSGIGNIACLLRYQWEE
ncbi:MAG: mRNA surveillance protein pelota [Candidatus Diapherotrites archaeon]|nr:mRNA surveillance protein pelota [Candidatus Diapherotrites archaeon]